MSILLQQKNVGDYSYMSSPNIYYRALFLHYRIVWREMLFLLGGLEGEGKAAALLKTAIRESF